MSSFGVRDIIREPKVTLSFFKWNATYFITHYESVQLSRQIQPYGVL